MLEYKWDYCFHLMSNEVYNRTSEDINISYDNYELILVSLEDKYNFYGSFVHGLGLINVRFPKSSCRRLNEEEFKNYNNSGYDINNNYYGKLKIKTTPEKYIDFS